MPTTAPAEPLSRPPGFVGRRDEVAALLRLLDEDGPRAAFVHGVAGVGKSALLGAVAAAARERGATVLEVDGREAEPTEAGFRAAVDRAAGGRAPGELPEPALLTVDTFEALGLVDRRVAEWARGLPAHVRLAVAGRLPPSAPWLAVPGLRIMPLGPLPARDAEALLVAAGLPADSARRVNRVVRGYPLALTVAAGTEPGGHDLAETALQRAVAELVQAHLGTLDEETRRVVEAAALVRRVTLPLLGAMVPDVDARAALDALRRLPFAEARRDGVALHEAIQTAVDELLRAEDPGRRRQLRRAAWHALRRALRDADREDLWRHTADMLFLIEHPVVREAFFPAEPRTMRIDELRPGDERAMREIAAHHDPGGIGAFDAWWSAAPGDFKAVRDGEDRLTGFSVVLRPGAVTPRTARSDPVAAAWLAHLRANPLPPRQTAIFDRWSLAAEEGAEPSPVQAAAWLDIKRMYMEMRPHLRRVYSCVPLPDTYLPTLGHLGFEALGPVDLGASTPWAAVLDFGPASVDGWLSWLAAGELGIESDGRLDEERREIVVEGRAIALTPREFEVLRHLARTPGRAVPRRELLRDVWGYEGWGTNVVDVVVRSIRGKLGDRADMLETVRGVGYRFSPER